MSSFKYLTSLFFHWFNVIIIDPRRLLLAMKADDDDDDLAWIWSACMMINVNILKAYLSKVWCTSIVSHHQVLQKIIYDFLLITFLRSLQFIDRKVQGWGHIVMKHFFICLLSSVITPILNDKLVVKLKNKIDKAGKKS